MKTNTKKANKLKPKLHLKKGDIVKVISGDDKGKQGRVLTIFNEKKRAIVEGVKIISRHTKPSQEDPKGGIIKKESAVHISNLMVIDPKTNEPTRIGRKRVDGKIVRVAKKTGEVID